MLRRGAPIAVILDIMLGGESTWPLLSELKANPSRRRSRCTSSPSWTTSTRRWRSARTASPRSRSSAAGCSSGSAAAAPIPRERVVVVDDDAASRYLLGGLLAETRFEAVEATDGARASSSCAPSRPPRSSSISRCRGRWRARARELRADPATRGCRWSSTRAELDAGVRARLAGASAIISKEAPSRATALQRSGRRSEAVARAGAAEATT